MSIIDWVIIIGYVTAAFAIGLMFTKKASESTTDFFVAGRSLPWYIAGTSMVATTFSSDTPLFVAAAARESGIYTNWIWWSAAPAALATVFFFAHLWRRSEAITELEFIAKRYDAGMATQVLRILRTFNEGLFGNAIIMATVTLAMTKIITVFLDLPDTALLTITDDIYLTPATLVLTILGLMAVIYTALSGLYGVVYTDLIQFALAMFGSIALAIIVYIDLDKGAGIVENLSQAEGYNESILWMLPSFESFDLELITFLILIIFSWIGTSPGIGHFVQRILATRSEKDAILSIYWYAFANYILRSWPWIIVGVASLVYFPSLIDPEQAYPEMIDRFLPVGLKGIMVASLLAAFMSTLDTHLNWGTSYLIQDLYRPYIKKNKTEKHYVFASRICMLLLALISILVASQLSSILGVYKFLMVMGAGNAFLVIARWYWWRITIWTEIASLISSFVVGVSLMYLLPDDNGQDYFAVRLFINMLITTTICLIVTYVSSSNGPTEQCIKFYKNMKIHGSGWKKVKDLTGVEAISSDLKTSTYAWLSSLILLYSLLFGIGYMLFEDTSKGIMLLSIALIALIITNKYLKVIIKGLK